MYNVDMLSIHSPNMLHTLSGFGRESKCITFSVTSAINVK